MKTLRIALLSLVCVSAAHAQNITNQCPIDVRQYTSENQCLAPDSCTYVGIRVGLVNDITSTAPPQSYTGVDIDNTANVSGAQTFMRGVNSSQTLQTGNTCDAMYGVVSGITVTGGSTATQIVHFDASEFKPIGSTITSSTGLSYVPAAGALEKTVLICADTAAKLKHAGTARFGATGDPTAGYKLDVQGALLVSANAQINAGHVGPSPSPTTSPTPTSATPTTTGASATPTATSTPDWDVERNAQVKGTLHVVGTSAFDDATTVRKDQNAATVALVRNNSAGATAFADAKVQSDAATGFIRAYSSTFIGGAPFTDSIAIVADTDASGGLNLYSGIGNVTLWSNGVQRARWNTAGQLEVTGTALTGTNITACGTSPSMGALSYDNSGTLTVGTIATTCTMTFSTAFAQIPRCFANDQTGVLAVRAIPSTTTVVFTTATAASISSQVIDWWCVGKY